MSDVPVQLIVAAFQDEDAAKLVGKRWNLKPGGDWGDAQPDSRLVMIGLPGGIDASWLEETIKD